MPNLSLVLPIFLVLTIASPAQSPVLSTNDAFFALSVRDMDASTKWYVEKLGLAVIMHAPRTAATRASATILRGGGLTVELIQRDSSIPRNPMSAGMFKAGVTVDDFGGTVAALRARGVEIAYGPYPRRPDQPANLIFRDNEGNLIQLFERASGEIAGDSCPRPLPASLTRLSGQWAVVWEYRRGDSLLTVDSAKMSFTVANRGCALLEQLEGRLRGEPLGSTAIITVPDTLRLQRAYVDSEHGTILTMEGRSRGDSVVFDWSNVMEGGRRLLLRHVYRVTATGFSTQTFMSPNGGDQWLLVQRVRATSK
ncbi:MAG TPA: VOC family protein [Gemmatimonadales bacterium]|nr:VOC family protein [Gemmatimonadales bacterium]